MLIAGPVTVSYLVITTGGSMQSATWFFERQYARENGLSRRQAVRELQYLSQQWLEVEKEVEDDSKDLSERYKF
jgi:hypothetical protein